MYLPVVLPLGLFAEGEMLNSRLSCHPNGNKIFFVTGINLNYFAMLQRPELFQLDFLLRL
jgi:hypothetical protein